MGKVRKITGVQGQIDAANRNADAQNAATKAAADAQAAALVASAKAAADAQRNAAARLAVEDKASDAASQPLGTADVQLDEDATTSVSARRNQRKAAFGKNYSTGVSI